MAADHHHGHPRAGEIRLRGLARDIALKDLDLTWQVFQKTGTVWENYAPDAIAPGKPAKPDLVGWTGLGPSYTCSNTPWA